MKRYRFNSESCVHGGWHMAIAYRSVLLYSSLAVSLLCSAGFAQSTKPVAAASSSADTRESLYTALAQDVEALERQGSILKRVVQLATPTVVHIESKKREPGSFQPTIEEAGSGVVIEIDGHNYVLTNRHVISDAALTDIKIRLHDGVSLQAKEVWSDSETDVAVIELKETSFDLVTARLGDSDKLDIGDFVLAVGSPFGLSHSVSYGIISAKGRRDLELGNDEIRLQDFLQTDAAINPGNSGGPLINLRGEVVGINTAIASNSGGNEGVSFAIPISLVMFTAEQLIATGTVEHAYIGVTLDSTFNEDAARKLGLKKARGALVRSVRPKSPSFFANIKVNDVIVGYNGQLVEDDDHLVNLVSLTPVNQTVTLNVVRQRQPVTLTITVGRRSNFE
ncbi:MAG: trypsin-like peptidase domain-containing protein [Planctomycetales bacterium]|nr:trypsin-like peptidase domain-containing protein [Planctomycetales bacterium]